MSDDQLNAALRGIAAERDNVSPELLQSIAARIGSSIEPVRPLPQTWVFVTALFLWIVGVAIAGAAILGLYGFRAMSIGVATAMLCSLGVFAVLTAVSCVQLGIPGSRLSLSPWVLLTTEALALAALFAAWFNDYDTRDFIAQGVRCLVAGLVQAVLAGLLVWLVLRRCFALNVRAAGLARGMLAGLAGVIMLELHCARLQVIHLAVWHTAVLPASAVAGLLIADAVLRLRGPQR